MIKSCAVLWTSWITSSIHLGHNNADAWESDRRPLNIFRFGQKLLLPCTGKTFAAITAVFYIIWDYYARMSHKFYLTSSTDGSKSGRWEIFFLKGKNNCIKTQSKDLPFSAENTYIPLQAVWVAACFISPRSQHQWHLDRKYQEKTNPCLLRTGRLVAIQCFCSQCSGWPGCDNPQTVSYKLGRCPQ